MKRNSGRSDHYAPPPATHLPLLFVYVQHISCTHGICYRNSAGPFRLFFFTRNGSTYNKSSEVAEMGDRLATIDMGRKVGVCCVLSVGGAGSSSNTMSPWSRPTSVPSDILIHPTVWPQYNNVTDRQDKQDKQDNGTVA